MLFRRVYSWCYLAAIKDEYKVRFQGRKEGIKRVVVFRGLSCAEFPLCDQ
jgi:hypothetical protein